MHPIVYRITRILLSALLVPALLAQPLDDGLLAQLRAEASRTHPSAVAAKLRAAATAQEVRAVRLWDDPRVGLGTMAANRTMRADLGDLTLGVEQMLPKPGLFDAQRRKAEATHRAEGENSRSATLAAAGQAAKAAIELALADESITLLQSQLSWLTAMTENARQLAIGPMDSHLDALRMETELAKEQQMLDAARRNRDGLSQHLNLTLGRPLDAPWPPLVLPAEPPPVPVATAEIARIARANPQVRAMQEMAGAATAETAIADRSRLPEISVGFDTNVYSRGDWRSSSLGVKMSLPWLHDRSYQANIAAAHNRQLAAIRDTETMRRKIATEVLSAATEATTAAAQARAYGGEVHAKAQLTTRTIEAAWISSKATLTDLLDSARMLYAIRLEQRRFIAMQLAALEELRALVPSH